MVRSGQGAQLYLESSLRSQLYQGPLGESTLGSKLGTQGLEIRVLLPLGQRPTAVLSA